MLLRDLTKVWIAEYETTNHYGEIEKKWKYKGTAWLNLQQDRNEFDKVDVYQGIADEEYAMEEGNGITFQDFSKQEKFIPEYELLNKNKMGNTFSYQIRRRFTNNVE